MNTQNPPTGPALPPLDQTPRKMPAMPPAPPNPAAFWPTYRAELKARFSPNGCPARLILYGDGEAYVETLGRAVRVALNDPMHPRHPAFSPALYLEV